MQLSNYLCLISMIYFLILYLFLECLFSYFRSSASHNVRLNLTNIHMIRLTQGYYKIAHKM